MKAKFLLAAVATLSAGAAIAQSSVTVYGRFNTSIERQTDYASPKSVYVLANNGSRLGFKGTEDLGGGLKAGFVLEHRFNSDTGASTNGTSFWGGAGTSEVNLSSDAMGMVRLGHFTSEAYFATSDVTDLLNHGTGTSSDAFYKYLGNDSNKVSYRTPSFAGATVELGTSLGEGVTANRVMDLAVNYGAGPLGLGFGYEKVKNGDSQYAIRANFETGPFLVTGYVQRYKNEALSENQTIYRISGMYTMGASEFHLAFGKQGDLGPVDVSAKQYTIGYNYNLSKRTKVYTYYNKISVDAAGSPDPKTIAVGIRHNF